MLVDSKKQHLNIGQILSFVIRDEPHQYPPNVMMPAILTELNHPNVKTKQFGNTLFEVIEGESKCAYIKAFNADTGGNYVDNAKLFLVWAKRILGLKHLVLEFQDQNIERLIKIVFSHPPLPNMTYKMEKLPSGKIHTILNLGE